MKYRQAEKHEKTAWFRHFLSTPFIYFPLVFILLLDVWIELYHRTCFPLYRIPYLKRSDFIRLDRHKLSYLSFLEKINCTYCAYANGWFRYASAIAKETEYYWCGITHKKYAGYIEPSYHKDFLPYGDEKAFEEFVNK